MSEYMIDGALLTSIAEEVRNVDGSSSTLTPAQMATRLNAVKSSIDSALSALTENGVEVPSGSTVHTLAELIAGAGGGLPDGINEIEVVTFTGAGSYTQTIPCGLSDTPSCVVIYSSTLDVGTQKVTAGIWVHGYFTYWYATAASYIYANATPLSNGKLTIKTGTSNNMRFLHAYTCVMWR